MKTKGRTMQLAICVLVVLCALIFVVSSFASGMCRDHDCAGEQCAICLCISIMENISRILAVVLASVPALALTVIVVRAFGHGASLDFADKTPVCLKVKLSD